MTVNGWITLWLFVMALDDVALLIGALALWKRRPPGNRLMLIWSLSLTAIVANDAVSTFAPLLLLDRRQLQLSLGAIAISKSYLWIRTIARTVRSGLCWYFILHLLALVNGGSKHAADSD